MKKNDGRGFYNNGGGFYNDGGREFYKDGGREFYNNGGGSPPVAPEALQQTAAYPGNDDKMKKNDGRGFYNNGGGFYNDGGRDFYNNGGGSPPVAPEALQQTAEYPGNDDKM